MALIKVKENLAQPKREPVKHIMSTYIKINKYKNVMKHIFSVIINVELKNNTFLE